MKQKQNIVKPLIVIITVGIVIISSLIIFFDLKPVFNKFVSSKEKKLSRATIAFQGWVGYGLLYLAKAKGFFAEEDIDAILINEELDSARRDALRSGILDFEAGTLDLLISKVANDTPIAAVMELGFSYGGDGIVAVEDIKKLEDLIGRKVALTRNDVNETFIAYLFYEAKLPFNEINIIYRSTDEVGEAFLRGEADAVVTWQPYLLEALKRPGAHMLISSKEKPSVIFDTLNVRRDLIENNPKLVRGVMRAWFKALKYYDAHPDEASAIIAPYYQMTAQEYRKNIEGMRWLDYSEQASQEHSRKIHKIFEDISAIKFMNKSIKVKPKAEEAINTSLLEGLYEDSK